MQAKVISPGLNAEKPIAPTRTAVKTTKSPMSMNVDIDTKADITADRGAQIEQPMQIINPAVEQQARDMYRSVSGIDNVNNIIQPTLPPLPIPGADNARR